MQRQQVNNTIDHTPAQIPIRREASPLSRALTSGTFCFVTASALLSVAVNLFDASVWANLANILAVSFLFGLLLAWYQWNNHDSDLREMMLIAIENAIQKDVNNDGAIGNPTTTAKLIGYQTIPVGGEGKIIDYEWRVTLGQMYQIWDKLQRNGYIYSRSQIYDSGLTPTRRISDEIGKMLRRNGLYKEKSSVLSEDGKELFFTLCEL